LRLGIIEKGVVIFLKMGKTIMQVIFETTGEFMIILGAFEFGVYSQNQSLDHLMIVVGIVFVGVMIKIVGNEWNDPYP
jgi:hypothetical protein